MASALQLMALLSCAVIGCGTTDGGPVGAAAGRATIILTAWVYPDSERW